MQTWYQTWCPKCQAQNWVCDGDTNDETAPDIGSLECRACQFLYLPNQDQLILPSYEIKEFLYDHDSAMSLGEKIYFAEERKVPLDFETVEKQQWFFREFLGVTKGVMMVEDKK